MTTKADYILRDRFVARGITVTLEQARVFRLAESTLSRWDTLECGDSNDYASWSIERDEETDTPYLCRYPHNSNNATRTPIRDKEKGALKRVAALCKELGLYYYHQGDPRGCSLYIHNEPFQDFSYTNGVSCCT